MNKYIKSDNDNGYAYLKLAVGGAISSVLSTWKEVELQYISPLIITEVLDKNNLSYNQLFIAKGKGKYSIRFEVMYSTPIIIEVNLMTGTTNIRKI